jgi:hypothetical protein
MQAARAPSGARPRAAAPSASNGVAYWGFRACSAQRGCSVRPQQVRRGGARAPLPRATLAPARARRQPLTHAPGATASRPSPPADPCGSSCARRRRRRPVAAACGAPRCAAPRPRCVAPAHARTALPGRAGPRSADPECRRGPAGGGGRPPAAREAAPRAQPAAAAAQPAPRARPLPPRTLAYEEAAPGVEEGESRVIVVTSGKGGVGKTTGTANLGMSIARCGPGAGGGGMGDAQGPAALAAYASGAAPRAPRRPARAPWHPANVRPTFQPPGSATRWRCWTRTSGCATWTCCWGWRTACCTPRSTSWRASAASTRR